MINYASVVIGRNEGQNLLRCFNSLLNQCKLIVYVDSGSTDDSVSIAKNLGVKVVELDMSIPFTAARARNTGFNFLINNFPEIELIQFVDGDCEVQDSWLDTAVNFLKVNLEFAAVCGRRRERYPNATIYNLICDIEWDTPVGEVEACGGDALIRVSALNTVNGYNDNLIAGEEPEMCFRMRQLGWKVMRLDAEMTLHDAAMSHFAQWWKRNKRAGHAYAEGNALHGRAHEKFKLRECQSIILWSALLPTIILALGLWHHVMFLLLLVYPLQFFRLMFRYQIQFKSLKPSIIYALSNVLGKWPQLIGMVDFKINSMRGIRSHLIEYK